MKHANRAAGYLKQVTLFSACTDKELELIATTTTQLRFSAGEVLAREGERGHEFMVIVDGKARVDISGRPIAVLAAGEFFGEIALLDGGLRTASVIAESDVVAEVIGQREFASVLLDAPHLARNLLVGLARRLRDADVQLAK